MKKIKDFGSKVAVVLGVLLGAVIGVGATIYIATVFILAIKDTVLTLLN